MHCRWDPGRAPEPLFPSLRGVDGMWSRSRHKGTLREGSATARSNEHAHRRAASSTASLLHFSPSGRCRAQIPRFHFWSAKVRNEC
jgi:hypothetical protein